MIQPEGVPLNKRPTAGPKPQWRKKALNSMLNKIPILRALHKPPPIVEVEDNEEELLRAYTGPGAVGGSLSGSQAKASSFLRKGKEPTTGTGLPPDVREVNPFLLPRKGDNADKEEEQEMTTNEVSEQKRANKAYLAATTLILTIGSKTLPNEPVAEVEKEEGDVEGSLDAIIKAFGIDQYQSAAHEAAKKPLKPETKRVANEAPDKAGMQEQRAGTQDTVQTLPIAQSVSTTIPIVPTTEERPVEVPVREGDRPASAAELATVINTAWMQKITDPY